MAWYALYKWFIQFRKTPYDDVIKWYKRFLYEEWFNSLPEDKQKAELERKRKLQEKRKLDSRTALMQFIMLCHTMDEMTGGMMSEYAEIYHTVNRISQHPSKYW